MFDRGKYIVCEIFPGVRAKVRKLYLSELLQLEQCSTTELPGYLMSLLGLPFWQLRRLRRLPLRVLATVLQNVLRCQYATLADRDNSGGDWRRQRKFVDERFFYDVCRELALQDERRKQRDKYEIYFAALLSMINRALGGKLSAGDALLDLGGAGECETASEELTAADAVAALGQAIGARVIDLRPEAFRSSKF